MATKVVLMLSLLVSQVLATELPCDPQIWTVEKKPLKFCYSEKHDAKVSLACMTKKCGACDMLTEAKTVRVKPSRRATANPGSDVCRDLKGEVQLGYNKRGSQIAFCQAKDGTMVDLFSLAMARTP